jgi:NhaP-type Na+/H+ or K+/H+ antiporter
VYLSGSALMLIGIILMGYTLSIAIQQLGVKLESGWIHYSLNLILIRFQAGEYYILPKQNKNDEQIVAMATIVTTLCK